MSACIYSVSGFLSDKMSFLRGKLTWWLTIWAGVRYYLDLNSNSSILYAGAQANF